MQGQAVHNGPAIAVAKLQIRCFQHAHMVCLLNKYRKNGAPTAPIIMPTGSSVGAQSKRASVSQKVTTAAPSKADAGRSSL
ncbi:hypothetical protein D3C75_1254270 [compost metagenome]